MNSNDSDINVDINDDDDVLLLLLLSNLISFVCSFNISDKIFPVICIIASLLVTVLPIRRNCSNVTITSFGFNPSITSITNDNVCLYNV